MADNSKCVMVVLVAVGVVVAIIIAVTVMSFAPLEFYQVCYDEPGFLIFSLYEILTIIVKLGDHPLFSVKAYHGLMEHHQRVSFYAAPYGQTCFCLWSRMRKLFCSHMTIDYRALSLWSFCCVACFFVRSDLS